MPVLRTGCPPLTASDDPRSGSSAAATTGPRTTDTAAPTATRPPAAPFDSGPASRCCARRPSSGRPPSGELLSELDCSEAKYEVHFTSRTECRIYSAYRIVHFDLGNSIDGCQIYIRIKNAELVFGRNRYQTIAAIELD